MLKKCDKIAYGFVRHTLKVSFTLPSEIKKAIFTNKLFLAAANEHVLGAQN